MTTEHIYTCSGSVRGSCRVVHKTAEAAFKCVDQDHRDCERHGGYSDRQVFKLDAEETRHVREGIRYSWLTTSVEVVDPEPIERVEPGQWWVP